MMKKIKCLFSFVIITVIIFFGTKVTLKLEFECKYLW